MRIQSARIQGFTLLELLVVVSLLAVLATAALLSNEGVNDQAELDVTKAEIAALRKALLQFRRDTGVLPGQGDYACESAPTVFNANLNNIPAYVAPADKVDWCKSSANFWMLFSDPISSDLNNWNPDTRRGWNGPYLTKSGPGYLDADKPRLRGLSDGFSNTNAVWRIRPEDTVYVTAGSPYHLLDADDPTATDDTDGVARLVSFGPDGTDGAGGVLNAAHDSCTPIAGSDDIVLCLLK